MAKEKRHYTFSSKLIYLFKEQKSGFTNFYLHFNKLII